MNTLTKAATVTIPALGIAALMALSAPAQADTLLIVGGTRVPWNTAPPAPNEIDYPASIFDMGFSVAKGVEATEARVWEELEKNPNEVVVLHGISQGEVVLNHLQWKWKLDPEHAPPPGSVRFVHAAGPESPTGFFTQVVGAGNIVPIFNVVAKAPITGSQYDTVYVTYEFDGAGHWPDRPNPIAIANAVMGLVYIHPRASGYVPPGTEPFSVTVDPVTGATTTTYLIHTKELPLYKPLRQLGLDGRIVDAMDAATRPIVESGYSMYDKKTAQNTTVQIPVNAPSTPLADKPEPVVDEPEGADDDAKPVSTPKRPKVTLNDLRESFRATPGGKPAGTSKKGDGGKLRDALTGLAESFGVSVPKKTDKPADADSEASEGADSESAAA